MSWYSKIQTREPGTLTPGQKRLITALQNAGAMEKDRWVSTHEVQAQITTNKKNAYQELEKLQLELRATPGAKWRLQRETRKPHDAAHWHLEAT